MADARNFNEGTRPKIFINWDAFTGQGIPADWRDPFADAVMNAYTRWMNVAGVDLRPQFFGYTTNTAPANGELLVTMDIAFGGAVEPRLASAFFGTNTSTIIFHRRNRVDMTPWPWVPRNAQPNEIDMQAVFMHELGHALGLRDESASANDTMFGNYNYQGFRYGPFQGDVIRLAALYAEYDQNTLRQLRSRDGGNSWTLVANSVTTSPLRTNQSSAITAIRGAQFYALGWTGHPTWSRDHVPMFLLTDGSIIRNGAYSILYQESSVHGSAYASDDQGTVLWAWVQKDANATIRVAHSQVFSVPALSLPPGSDLGFFLTKAPTGARSCGTPGLAWTRVGGQSTWILVWPNFDRGDHGNTGLILASISTDEGATWSNPAFLNNDLKALSGVSIAANEANDALVAFAFANHLAQNDLNEIITLNCSVGGGRLQQNAVIRSGERTRIQPALAYDATHVRYVMAWREQNFATTIATAWMTPGSAAWGGKTSLGATSHVAPGLSASVDFNEVVLWCASDGP